MGPIVLVSIALLIAISTNPLRNTFIVHTVDNLEANSSYTPTHFDLFKNSPFSDPPLSCQSIANSSSNSSGLTINTAQARSEAHFCAHLGANVNKTYIVLPTTPTAAAFLPTWSSALLTFLSVCIQGRIIGELGSSGSVGSQGLASSF